MAAFTSDSRVCILHHAACEGHVVPGHPEQPKRVASIIESLRDLPDLVFNDNPPNVTEEQLLYFHTKRHITKILDLCDDAYRKTKLRFDARVDENDDEVARARLWKKVDVLLSLDGDTQVSSGTREAATRAAGAACEAVDMVMEGRAPSCFCVVRPPGHHAEPNEAMGFCLFNNVGIAAHHARIKHSIKRVAVLDWDVHHGNGTQAGFWSEKDLFFASSHQMPCYPGTGHPREKGAHKNIVNQALPPNSSTQHFRRAWGEGILPRLEEFKPELIIVSAGFDAHEDDPLAEIRLQDADYKWVQDEIFSVAERLCEGRVVSVLEGGYNLKAISRAARLVTMSHIESAERMRQKYFGFTKPTPPKQPVTDDMSEMRIGGAAEEERQQTLQVFTDDVLKSEFDRCHREGILRSNPREGQQRRWVDGPSHFCLSFDEAHFANKRSHGTPPQVDLKTPFDPSKFNFTKANPAERLCSYTSHDTTHNILANISPLMHSHCVLPVFCESHLPQLLTLPSLESAFHLLTLTQDVDHFRLVFNSLGAFASVNHLHLHLMYVDALGGEGHAMTGFPIEQAALTHVKALNNHTIHKVNWGVPCFQFSGGVEMVPSVHWLIEHLHSQGSPYNLLLARHEDGFKAWVIPRKPQHVFDPAEHGFNAAICEICGFIVANNQTTFEQATEESIVSSLSEHVALSGQQLDVMEEQLCAALH